MFFGFYVIIHATMRIKQEFVYSWEKEKDKKIRCGFPPTWFFFVLFSFFFFFCFVLFCFAFLFLFSFCLVCLAFPLSVLLPCKASIKQQMCSLS
ncbi:rCG29995, partial [Rattus norvegicus]